MKSVINKATVNGEKELEIITSKAIRELRVFVHHKGYRYLRRCIVLTVKDETLADDLKKRLYVMVAEEYGVNFQQVERSIRSVIERAWEQANIDIIEKYFGYYNPDDCPSNKRFITTVAEYIRLRL